MGNRPIRQLQPVPLLSVLTMKHARLFSLIVFPVLLGYGIVGFYFLPLASFQSELTRMGMLPESQFGWRKPQPEIKPAWLTQASMQEADVLVIGDSFSDGRIWQTTLTQRDLKVRTESWDSLRGICADFAPWLRAQGFHGRYVVLEIIERNIPNNLRSSLACQQMQIHPNAWTDKPRLPPSVSFDPDHMGRSGRFSVGLKTALSYANYEQLSRAPDFKSAELRNGATVARIPDGCKLFSHARCNDSLFLSEDKPDEVAADVLENMAEINTRMDSYTPIWALVPNKSTAYRYSDKQFWNLAEQRFGSPNLLRMTRRALQSKTVDLYPANNTHFSTTGYLLMGEEIAAAILAKMQP